MARYIPEAVFESPTFGNTSLSARLFYIGLSLICEHNGVIDPYRPRLLLGQLFPFDEDTVESKDLKSWLDELTKAGLIKVKDSTVKLVCYKAAGRPKLDEAKEVPPASPESKKSPKKGKRTTKKPSAAGQVIFDPESGLITHLPDRYRTKWKNEHGWSDPEIDFQLARAGEWLTENPEKMPKKIGLFLHKWMVPNKFSQPGTGQEAGAGPDPVHEEAPDVDPGIKNNIRANLSHAKTILTGRGSIISPVDLEDALASGGRLKFETNEGGKRFVSEANLAVEPSEFASNINQLL